MLLLFFPSRGLGMAEPIELKFSLNNVPHPSFKVCDEEVDPSRRWPAVPRKRSVNSDFRRFSLMLKWWVDISLCFTPNKHHVLWQTLSPMLSYIRSSLVPRIRRVFRVRSPDLFPSRQGIHLMRVQRAFITCYSGIIAFPNNLSLK